MSYPIPAQALECNARTRPVTEPAPESSVANMTERVEREMAQTRQSLGRQVTQMGVLSKYLEGLLSSLDVGVVAVDAAGHVMTINRAAEEMLGVGADHARGMSYEELAAGVLPPAPVMEAIRTEQAPCPARHALTRADGGQLLVECSVSLIRDAHFRVIGALQVLKDISPIEALEKKLERSARLAYLGKVAATLAHEVRNPLSAVEGFAHLLARDMAPGDPRRRFAENIITAVRDLEQAMTSTLIFARPPQLKPAALEPGELLAEVQEFASQEIAAKHLHDIRVTVVHRACPDAGREGSPFMASLHGEPRVETDRPARRAHAQGEGMRVIGDREQLKRVLLNLVKNAMDALPEGGEIRLCCAASPESAEERPMIRLSVEDTGCGISPEIRDRLFEPFETTKPHGNGLGLAAVKTIVELHGGKVSAESASGGGAAFHLDLPAAFENELPRE